MTWLKLTDAADGTLVNIRADLVAAVYVSDDGETVVDVVHDPDTSWHVKESPVEVMAMLEAADRSLASSPDPDKAFFNEAMEMLFKKGYVG